MVNTFVQECYLTIDYVGDVHSSGGDLFYCDDMA